MTMPSLEHTTTLLNSLAPLAFAEQWDKVGVQVIGDGRAISRVLLTIDLVPSVLEEATSIGADLVVAYHPLLFTPLHRLDGVSWQSRVAISALRRGIAVYSPHTALDNATDGVNDWLIESMGAGARSSILAASTIDASQEYRIVVFVPGDAVEGVRDALAASGAGHIGDYSACSFAGHGGGTFLPGATSHPVIGSRGKLERVPELRLEMPCSSRALPAALAAMRKAHPYEEPAFDVVKSDPRPDATQGAGRIMQLDSPSSAATLAARVKTHLGIESIMLCAGEGQSDALHSRVAACAGSGGALLDAAISAGATLFLTGELSHHETLAARERGVTVLLAGHTNTERGYLARYAERIRAAAQQQELSMEVCVAASDCEILRSV